MADWAAVLGCHGGEPDRLSIAGAGEAKINLLGGSDLPDLVWADRMTRAEIRRAVRLVAEQRAFLLARWEEIHERPRRP